MKKNYHAKSCSKQARKLADRFFQSYENKDEGLADLKNSYRCKLIKYRAIKRYVRLLKSEV